MEPTVSRLFYPLVTSPRGILVDVYPITNPPPFLPKPPKFKIHSGWVFPIMWLVVSKPTQFAAIWRLIIATSLSKKVEGGARLLSVPLLAYCAHLSLGDAWNKVFFGTESTGLGLVVICAFWSVLWLSACLFYRADPYAGLLLLPTCLWVTVAASLNWSIHLLNGEKRRV